MLAYHYHYRLDYIDTLDLHEIKELIDYIIPKEKTKKAPEQNELSRKLELFKKIKEEESRQK